MAKEVTDKQLETFAPEVLDKGQSELLDNMLDDLDIPAATPLVVPVEVKPVETVEEKPGEKPVGVPPKEEVKPVEEKDEIAEMREMLNTYARQLAVSKSEKTTEKPVEEVKPPEKEIPKDIIKFLTQEEADVLIDNPEILNSVLTRVFYAAQESVLKSIPETTRQAAREQVAVLLRADRFYAKNSDLVSYKDFTAMIAAEVEMENPTWDIDKVYEETAKVARARLRLAEVAETKTDRPAESTSPAFPVRTQSSRKPNVAPKVVDEQLSEIEKMLEYERTGR